MKRHDQLIAYIENVRERPFVWGSWDCCQFVGQWVHELTGKDYRNAFPAYTGESDAREILGSAGGLKPLISSLLQEIHVSRAMKGDLVLSNDEGGAALGICLGFHSAHVGPNGLVYLPTHTGLCAWRVE